MVGSNHPLAGIMAGDCLRAFQKPKEESAKVIRETRKLLIPDDRTVRSARREWIDERFGLRSYLFG